MGSNTICPHCLRQSTQWLGHRGPQGATGGPQGGGARRCGPALPALRGLGCRYVPPKRSPARVGGSKSTYGYRRSVSRRLRQPGRIQTSPKDCPSLLSCHRRYGGLRKIITFWVQFYNSISTHALRRPVHGPYKVILSLRAGVSVSVECEHMRECVCVCAYVCVYLCMCECVSVCARALLCVKPCKSGR